MSIHPSKRVLSLLIRTALTSARDSEVAVYSGTGAASGGRLPNGEALAATQTAFRFRKDWTSIQEAVEVTKDGGTTWTGWQTLSDIELVATSDITIATGAATLTGAVHTIRGEGAAADNLDTISGMADAEVAFLICGAEAITVRDAAVGGGNISTDGDTSLVLATGDLVMAVRSGTVIRVAPLVVQAGLPAGSLALARGFVIVGNSSGIAESLDGGANQGIIYSDGTDMKRGTIGAHAQITTSSVSTGITAAGADTGTRVTGVTAAGADTGTRVTGVTAAGANTAAGGTGATGAPSADDTAGATAASTAETRVGSAHYVNPIAEEYISIIADVLAADGAQIIAGQPDCPRTLVARITIAVNPITAGDMTVVGVGQNGQPVSRVVSLITAVSTDRYLPDVFATVTSATIAGLTGGGGAGDNIGMGVSAALGLPACAVPVPSTWAVYKTVVDGVDETVAGVDAANGSVTPTTAPNAVHDYDFYYTYSVTPTQSAHQHGPGNHTHTGPSHDHAAGAITVTDGGHDHAAGAITVTEVAHAHTGTPDAHVIS